MQEKMPRIWDIPQLQCVSVNMQQFDLNKTEIWKQDRKKNELFNTLTVPLTMTDSDLDMHAL